jgi:hypothetical protein
MATSKRKASIGMRLDQARDERERDRRHNNTMDAEWERWRGEITERVGSLVVGQDRIEAAIHTLGQKFDTHATEIAKAMTDHQAADNSSFATVNGEVGKVMAKLASLKGRVAIVSVVLGAGIGAGVQYVLKHFLG